MRSLLIALASIKNRLSYATTLNRFTLWRVTAVLPDDGTCVNDGEHHKMRSLGEFFGLRDMAFVEAAYLLMLRRSPDPIGREYYLSRLRGGYSQISVLDQLWKAADAEPLWSEVPKLREQLEWYRDAIRPPLGLWRRYLHPAFGVSRSLRRVRANENDLARTRQEVLAKFGDLSSEVTLLRDFVGRLAHDRQSSSPGRIKTTPNSKAPVSAQSLNVGDALDIELSSVGRDVLRSLRD